MIYKNNTELCRAHDIPESSFRKKKKKHPGKSLSEIVQMCKTTKETFLGYPTKRAYLEAHGITPSKWRYFNAIYPALSNEEIAHYLESGTTPDIPARQIKKPDEYQDVKEKPIKPGFYIFTMHHADRE